MQPALVSVSGLASNVGKTTLVCELLRRLSGWEAVKVSRGHYRSCGKSKEVCCVSHLLSEQPIVRSGQGETFEPGKDTGRYWESGASNVHWVICTDAQLEDGIRAALSRVQAPGVIIEGTSFLKYVVPDFSIMVADPQVREVKSSAARAIRSTNALFVSGLEIDSDYLKMLEEKLRARGSSLEKIPVYTRGDIEMLAERVSGLRDRVDG